MNKDQELLSFHRFLELNKHLNTWERSESPDFIITYENRKIGIEITELIFETIHGVPIAKKYSLEDEIIKLVYKELRLKSHFKILASIQFDEKLNVSKKDMGIFASKISEIISNFLIGKPNILTHHLAIIEDLPAGVNGVYLDIIPLLGDSIIYAQRGKCPVQITIDHLNDLIKRKNKIIELYKRKVDEIYLVIVHGLSFSSTHGNFSINTKVIPNEFNRIFLLDVFHTEIIEI